MTNLLQQAVASGDFKIKAVPYSENGVNLILQVIFRCTQINRYLINEVLDQE